MHHTLNQAPNRSITEVTQWQLSSGPVGASAPDQGWIPAIVPGGVHESLIAAGVLPHPFRDRNETQARWIEERSWWYRTRIDLPARPTATRQYLRFEMLDTVATVWFGNELVAHHENQFRPLEIDVSERRGTIDVLVRVDPPLWGVEEPSGPRATRDRMLAYFARQGAMVGDRSEEPLADLRFTRRRKAVYSWGWDFAPRLPSVGVVGAVLVETLPADRIVAAHANADSVEGEGAEARLNCEVTLTSGFPEGHLLWRLEDADGLCAARATTPSGEPTVSLQVAEARLWWTHDLGAPHQYRLVVTATDTNGTILDEIHTPVGIRSLVLDTAQDSENGRAMRFVLNGVPIFARGANWVPPSMLPGSVTPAQIRHSVHLAKAGNLTMLRVWGGGLYPPDAFFTACDEAGILVWQDFMFTSVDYPDAEPRFRDEVRAEISHQILRLRNHPCLALWAGNNEASAMHRAIWGSDAPGGWGDYFYDCLMPALVSELHPGAIYWRGSPHGTLDSINGVRDGDRHAWEVWHGGDLGAGGPQTFTDPGEAVHFWRYRHDRGRFISEFGIQSGPERSTLDRWVDEPLELGGEVWLHRIKDRPKDKGAALMATEAGEATTLNRSLTSSMMIQAEGLAYGIEHFRRRQPTCSGALVWQWNEPWPGVSWSLIDHDAVPKAAWYRLRTSFAPVLLSLRQPGVGQPVELWASNSARTEWTGNVVAELATFADDAVLEATTVEGIRLAAGASRIIGRLPCPVAPRSCYARIREVGDAAPPNRMFFDHLRRLPLRGTVTASVHADEDMRRDGRAEVTVRAHNGFAYAVRVVRRSPEERHSDAYFDVPHGQERTILVTGLPPGFDPQELRVACWQDGD